MSLLNKISSNHIKEYNDSFSFFPRDILDIDFLILANPKKVVDLLNKDILIQRKYIEFDYLANSIFFT